VLEDKEIQIFGDGSQMRDFVYVDDAADAFLRAGASDACDGDVFNVGGSEPITHRDLVALLIETAGMGSVRYVDWPPEKKRIDIGSFYSDSTKFQQATGWTPRVSLREGLSRTVSFYREHMRHYVDTAPVAPQEPARAHPSGRP
jgi:UDP-glucose 4-epimerase